MFIYKIVIEDKTYFGLDTSPSYKKSRWKIHCKESKKPNPSQKIHQEMKRVGIENCEYSIVEDGFQCISELALAEIEYIKKNKTYENGLNSSRGGDGLGKHDLSKLSNEDLLLIKQSLSKSMSDYNKNYKWANKSTLERKKLTSHLHCEEVYRKKSKSLKEYYKLNPDEKIKKAQSIKKWQEENREVMKNNNKINGLKGAEKVSKKLLVIKENGDTFVCKSKSEFNRLTGEWAKTVIDKTKKGLYHNGYKAREI